MKPRISQRLAALARNVAAGTRIALFLRVRWTDFRASPADYAALVAFNVLVWLVGAYVRSSGEVQFEGSALGVYLGTVPIILAGTLWIAAMHGAPALALLLAVVLSSSDLVMELVGIALASLPVPEIARWLLYPLFFAWIWLVALRAVAVSTGSSWLPSWRGGVAITALAAFLMFFYPKSEPWVASRDAPIPTAALAAEETFHLQGELIERQLSAIEAGKAGVPELYFVGFAPDGSQDVFHREMRYVRKLFDERYSTVGRSISLVSGDWALRESPVATTTNLRRVLERVGQRMNADEDVLFLFVSAHGDKRHHLSASQPPLVQSPLSPTALARLLQDSAAKWKVVVVSACYAGGFIEPLKDANTMVITAAAADRQSFGCENGRDFTYFGEAYFRDGLGQERDFAAAFEIAKTVVTKREAAENRTASMPQIWVGERIGEHLRKLEAKPAAR
jgi:hypothetical protein